MAPDLALSAHLFAYEPLCFDHLKEAAETGFRKIELWAMTPNFDVGDGARLKTLKGRLEDLSLTTPSFHAPFYADLSEARKGRWLSLADKEPDARAAALEKTMNALRAFRPLGARIVIIHPSAPGRAGDADTYEALRREHRDAPARGRGSRRGFGSSRISPPPWVAPSLWPISSGASTIPG